MFMYIAWTKLIHFAYYSRADEAINGSNLPNVLTTSCQGFLNELEDHHSLDLKGSFDQGTSDLGSIECSRDSFSSKSMSNVFL